MLTVQAKGMADWLDRIQYAFARVNDPGVRIWLGISDSGSKLMTP